VACWGKRVKQVNGKKIVLQKQIVVPRGALHEESVYGKIKTLERKPVKKLFEDPQLIYKPTIRRLVEDRLAENAGDLKKALASLAKNPIMLRNEVPLEFASCYKEEYVLKYPLQSLKAKDVNSIIDCRVREAVKQRLNQFNNNEKEAFKDIENNPVWMDE
jgi:CRISPR-associated endonuclease Csn1